MVKNLPVIQETWVQSLHWEDPLEEGMATHSSVLAWRIPWTEESAGYSPWCGKESDTTEQLTLSLSPVRSAHVVQGEATVLGSRGRNMTLAS